VRDRSRVMVIGPLERYASGWIAAERVAVSELSPERVGRFVEWRRAAGYRHFRSPRGLTPLLRYLRALGVAPEPIEPRAWSDRCADGALPGVSAW
jgi:hypothetical protein